MRYVIIRDDDTNALTPAAYLEKLYRPFLDRGLFVNLATIPHVRTDAKTPNGDCEGFLPRNGKGGRAVPARRVPIGNNQELIDYLKANPGFNIVQHGCDHSCFEFDSHDATDIAARLDEGRRLLSEAGLGTPRTFVAPHDKLSRAALREVARRFDVLSTGWYELRRLPITWWPGYAIKRGCNRPHWRAGHTILLTHPGCLLSCHRSYEHIPEVIQGVVQSQRLTVLVTHWWEYFRDGRPDQQFISVLHATADFLASDPEIRVLTFDDVVDSRILLS